MKEGIHPYYNATSCACASCGTTFETYSTDSELKVEICSSCHPFYTGKQRNVMRAGQVEKFRQRYSAKQSQ